MSIASEIERLKNAKTSIASAIEEKGVAVPAETSIDEYGNYVSLIPSGDYATKEELEALSNTANADTRVEYVDNVLKTLGGTEVDVCTAKIDMGSYVGTGKSNEENAVSLTFDFAPKFVFIYGTDSSERKGVALMDSIGTTYATNIFFSSTSLYVKKSSNGKTLSWYYKSSNSNGNGDKQFNKSATDYYYLAIA